MVGPRSTPGRTPPRVSSSTSPFPNRRPRDTPITAPPDAEVIRLFPEPTVRLKVEDVYGGISFPTRESRPYVLINMVASLDGKASVGGKAGAIGSQTDRILMRSLRACADAVMIGAGTLRAEKLRLDVPEELANARASRGLEPQPLAVLVTTSGDVPLGANLVGSSPDNLLIVTSPEIPKERFASLSSHVLAEIVTKEMATPGGHTGLDLGSALEALKGRYGVGLLLVEGGPSLNHSLISSSLADELFLTLAPKVFGGEASEGLTVVEGPLLRPMGIAPMLVSVHLFDDELFLRYALRSKEESH